MTPKQEMIAKLDDFEYIRCTELGEFTENLTYNDGISAAVIFAKNLIKDSVLQEKERYVEELDRLDVELRDELSDKDFLEERINVYEDYYWQLKSLTKHIINNL